MPGRGGSRGGKTRMKRRSKQNTTFDDEQNEDKKVIERIRGRRGRKRQANDDFSPFLQLRDDHKSYKIRNPPGYHSLVSRNEERQTNKAVVPAGTPVDGPWQCALCGRATLSGSLGDLFGPYYYSVDKPSLLPPFVKKPSRSRSSKQLVAAASAKTSPSTPSNSTSTTSLYVDLWFHGDCIIWAPGVLVVGLKLVGAQEHLPSVWKQTCSVCQKTGASIPCDASGCDKYFHYPCAVSEGPNKCRLQEEHFRCHCSTHKTMISE